jgi:hypothetical protein
MRTPIAVMISHVSRGYAGGLRDQSIQALQAAGINPTVVVSTRIPGSDTEVKRVAWHAIHHGANHPDGLLFFEDDITVNADILRATLNLDFGDHDLITLCLLRRSLLPASHQDRYSDGRTPYVVPIGRDVWQDDKRGFHGSMGLWLSPTLIARVISSKHEFMTGTGEPITAPTTPAEIIRGKPCGFDFWLRDRAMNPATVIPNAIGHRTDHESTIKIPRKFRA